MAPWISLSSSACRAGPVLFVLVEGVQFAALGPWAQLVRIEAHKLPLQLLNYDRAHLQSLTEVAYGPGDDTRVAGADVLEGYQHPHLRRSPLAGRGGERIGGHEASYRREWPGASLIWLIFPQTERTNVCAGAHLRGKLFRTPYRRSSQNSFKANFRESPDHELRHNGVLRSSALPWCSGALCSMAHIHSPQTGVCCLRYVASQRRVQRRVKAQDSYLPSS